MNNGYAPAAGVYRGNAYGEQPETCLDCGCHDYSGLCGICYVKRQDARIVELEARIQRMMSPPKMPALPTIDLPDLLFTDPKVMELHLAAKEVINTFRSSGLASGNARVRLIHAVEAMPAIISYDD